MARAKQIDRVAKTGGQAGGERVKPRRLGVQHRAGDIEVPSIRSGSDGHQPLLTGGSLRVNRNTRILTRIVPILLVADSMRENVRLFITKEVEPGAGGQEIKAGLGQFAAALAHQQGFQLCP